MEIAQTQTLQRFTIRKWSMTLGPKIKKGKCFSKPMLEQEIQPVLQQSARNRTADLIGPLHNPNSPALKNTKLFSSAKNHNCLRLLDFVPHPLNKKPKALALNILGNP